MDPRLRSDTNLYGYVLNDPINFIDPSGNVVPVIAAVGAVAAAHAIATAIAYGSVKLAEYLNQRVNGVADPTLIPSGRCGPITVERAFTPILAINGLEVLALGTAAAVPAIATTALTNPAAVQDFVQGLTLPGPPPQTIPGAAGSAAQSVIGGIVDQASNRSECGCP